MELGETQQAVVIITLQAVEMAGLFGVNPG